MNFAIFAGNYAQGRDLAKKLGFQAGPIYPNLAIICHPHDFEKLHGIQHPVCFLTGTWWWHFTSAMIKQKVAERRGTVWSEGVL